MTGHKPAFHGEKSISINFGLHCQKMVAIIIIVIIMIIIQKKSEKGDL